MKLQAPKYLFFILLLISLMGFILIKTGFLEPQYHSLVKDTYRVTVGLALLYLIFNSRFIKLKFTLLLKIMLAIIFIIISLEILSQLNIWNLDVLKLAPFILILGYCLGYSYFIFKYSDKTRLDYLKIAWVTLLVVSVFVT